MGDAKSITGGVLLQTPLLGADGHVYAVAQGALVLGGFPPARMEPAAQRSEKSSHHGADRQWRIRRTGNPG